MALHIKDDVYELAIFELYLKLFVDLIIVLKEGKYYLPILIVNGIWICIL